MTSINCSYYDTNGKYNEQICASSQGYCCSSTGSSYCSETQCQTVQGSFNFSTIAFWSILGGLLVVCSIVVGLAYAICYIRKPRGSSSRSPDEQLIEETIHQEETTVTSHKHVTDGSPSIEIRTERVKTITTRQRSRSNIFQGLSGDTVKINVSPDESNMTNKGYLRPAVTPTFRTDQVGRPLSGASCSPSSSTRDMPSVG